MSEPDRLTTRELHAMLDRLFPQGFAAADVLAEIAPEGWERSPLLSCFHPSVEQMFVESVRLHRNIERWRQTDPFESGAAVTPEPTLEDVRREHEPSPIDEPAEVTELVGLCLWDVFSDNHLVVDADGRAADIGSFRSAGAFLDRHLTRDDAGWRDGDHLRFYLGTLSVCRRADLTRVYSMIFRRLNAAGADWIYELPEAADVAARAGEAALDQPPPPIVGAYREVYGRDPRGWPPP